MNKEFIHKTKPPATLNAPALWCVFYNDQILLHKSELKQPLPKLKLYQRCGFVIDNLLKGYFTTYYPRKIIENGIQCSDKIYFKKEL